MIGDFLNAHDLPGEASVLRRALDADSPKRDRLLVKLAFDASSQGDSESAALLLAEVAPDCPLLEAAKACVQENASAAVAAVTSERLTESDDPELAMFGVGMLRGAYYQLGDFDSAGAMLRRAVNQFPEKPWLLYWWGHAAFTQAFQVGTGTSAGRDLLRQAVDCGLKARDLFRVWDGPSHKPVALAMDALLCLGEPQRAVDLGSRRSKDGEASDAEADTLDVYKRLAQNLQMLGRYGEIDTVRLDRISPSQSEVVRAMQAHDLGDAAAVVRMCRVVDQAGDDQSALRTALWGLAQLGEVDETAMSKVPAVDAVLFRGIAAFRQDNPEESITVLASHRFSSVLHAYHLAEAQNRAGAPGEAVKTLTEASEYFSSEPSSVAILSETAVEILIAQDKLEEAVSMAEGALALDAASGIKRRLRILLASIAERREDWTALENHARAWAQDFPEDDRAAWQVVYALHRQMRNRRAWVYLAGRDLVPLDEDTARLDIAVRKDFNAPEQDADRMLDLAEEHPHSEQVAGDALSALMLGSTQIKFTAQQRSRFARQLSDFTARFPESDMLQECTGERAEQLTEQIMTQQQELHKHFGRIPDLVRYGCYPYGLLRGIMRSVRERPYAELLLSLAEGAITAIPVDANRCGRERRLARKALGGKVAVDTSVAALGIHTELDICRMGAAFDVVFVADELIIDARMSVAAAKQPFKAVLPYNPGLGHCTVTEIDESQRAEARVRAERAVKALNGTWISRVPPDVSSNKTLGEDMAAPSGTWQQINSGHLPPLKGVASDPDFFKPWDAAIRIAVQRGCPLWCDDLSLRLLAESQGVKTFGTWALYEALTSKPGGYWLPEALDMKMNLLRAGVADVPITLPELDRAVDDSDGPDIAAERYLSRPSVWVNGGQTHPHTALDATFHSDAPDKIDRTAKTINWYIVRCEALGRGAHKQRVPELLYAACRGLAACYDLRVPEYAPKRQLLVSGLLAYTINAVKKPRVTAPPLGAAQSAVNYPITTPHNPPTGLTFDIGDPEMVAAATQTLKVGADAGFMFDIGDPEMVPPLLAAAQDAAKEIDPGAELDPLPDAALYLLEKLSAVTGAKAAAGTVTRLFAKADPEDRKTVMRIILGDR